MYRPLFRRISLARITGVRNGSYRGIDIHYTEVDRATKEDLHDELDRNMLKKYKFLVSSPHRVSYIRLIRFDPDEQVWEMERIYRSRLEELQLFHHHFWMDNNRIFDSYLANLEKTVRSLEARKPNNDELSDLYRIYINDSRERHSKYSSLWIKQNFKILPLAMIAGITKMLRSASIFFDSAANSLTERFPYIRSYIHKETLKHD